ncbi:MAG: ribokinase [Magnetospirillum sp.]|nr:ribokinase [Magnetospirillum sp.]
MIPALLAQIGLPLLTKLVGGALDKIDHPAAKVASQALGTVGQAMAGNEISPEQLAEANRHVERMAEIDGDVAKVTLSEVNTTIRAEAASEDPYTRRWRPTWGYVTAATWGLQTVAIVACLMGAVWASIEGKADVVTALLTGSASLAGALAVQWSVALAVLGVAVVKRSDDKSVAAGNPPATGLMGAIAQRLGGRS